MNPQATVLCLDFDGVLCNSVGELAMSGWGAMGELWPELADGDALRRASLAQGRPPAGFIEHFRRLRPALETGYQAVLMSRMIVDGVADDAVMGEFSGLCLAMMDRYGLDRDDLIGRFGSFRDRWMARDLDSWLAPHRMYPGIVEALNRWVAEGRELYILSTREKRFMIKLLGSAGVDAPQDRIFGLESISKLDRLELLIETDNSAPFALIEDRMETLLELCERQLLNTVIPMFADWGYNSAAERQQAAAHPRIEVITLEAFCRTP